MDAVISAWVAENCNRALGRESSEGEEFHGDLARDAKVNGGEHLERGVSTRWVLTWKIVDGEKCLEANLIAQGYQYPESK